MLMPSSIDIDVLKVSYAALVFVLDGQLIVKDELL